MTQFEQAANAESFPCDICGSIMIPFYGMGVVSDRMVCEDESSCGAEIVYPTSTPAPATPMKGDEK